MPTCEDCGNSFSELDGRFYKYEPGVWLCDDCYDARMREDDVRDGEMRY